MGNRHRGEVAFRLDGRMRMLRLTLGSLARLEAHYGGGLAGLAERLGAGRLAAQDVALILAAGLQGAGEEADAAELAERIPAAELGQAAEAAVGLLAAAFAPEGADPPRRPQAAP